MSALTVLQGHIRYLREVLQDSITPDLLQLAINCSMEATAEVAATTAPISTARLKPQLLCKLLVTAAKRKHFNIGIQMLGIQMRDSLVQHMDGPCLEEVVMMLIAGESSGGLLYQTRARLDDIWRALHPAVTAAQSLGSDVVLQLLQAAAHRSLHQRTALLLQLPAAQQLDADAVGQLLQTAVLHARQLCTRPLCIALLLLQRPAAKKLSQAGGRQAK